MSRDYDVGYGKPPRQHQFKKGNKKGGRKKSEKGPAFSMSELLTKAMTTRRRFRRGDRIVDMDMKELLVERVMHIASSGTPQQLGQLLVLLDRHAPHLVTPPAQETHFFYHRAPGSTVELPPPYLWKDDEK